MLFSTTVNRGRLINFCQFRDFRNVVSCDKAYHAIKPGFSLVSFTFEHGELKSSCIYSNKICISRIYMERCSYWLILLAAANAITARFLSEAGIRYLTAHFQNWLLGTKPLLKG